MWRNSNLSFNFFDAFNSTANGRIIVCSKRTMWKNREMVTMAHRNAFLLSKQLLASTAAKSTTGFWHNSNSLNHTSTEKLTKRAFDFYNCATNVAITLHNFSTSDIILEIKNEISIFYIFLSFVKRVWLFRKNCNGPFSFNYIQSLFLQWGNVLEGWKRISFSHQIRTDYFTFSN